MAEQTSSQYAWMEDDFEGTFLYVKHDLKEQNYQYSPRLKQEFSADYCGGDVILFLQDQHLIAPEEEASFEREISLVQQSRKKHTSFYSHLRRRDGGYHLYRILLQQIFSETAELTERLAILIDVDEEHHKISQLEREVDTDRLTGIYNESAFCRKAQKMMQTHSDMQFAVVRMHIERFRVINDMLGMKRGDEVLATVGRVIQGIAQSESQFPFCYGRIRGDVFAICFPHQKGLLDRVVDACAQQVNQAYPEYAISLEFGVYVVEDVEEPVSMMIDHANIASNSVRGNYLKRYAYYNKALHDSAINEQNVINGFEDALAREEFYILLQPKCRADNGEVVGAEALVRWRHPGFGIVPPDRFIPVLERKGLIYKLDRYVWERVCRVLKRQMAQGQRALPVSVNVSRVDLMQPGLCRVLQGLRKKYNIPDAMLELEVTESAGVDSFRRYAGTVKKLRDRGFKILLDDFGSAFSTLNVLCNMDLDVIKVDMRSIYTESQHVERKNALLRSLVLLAKELSLEIVIEGVETREQLNFLRTAGADYIQGYYFYEPMPVEEYEQLLPFYPFTECGF